MIPFIKTKIFKLNNILLRDASLKGQKRNTIISLLNSLFYLRGWRGKGRESR
jgi:hypothetical protein